MNEDESAQLEGLHLATPHTFAEEESGGEWVAYDWLIDVGRKVLGSLSDGEGRDAFSGPPRHGKSEFLSFWLPIWFLLLNPHKRVMHATYEASLSAWYSRRVRNWIRDNGHRYGVGIRDDLAKDREWGTTVLNEDGEWVATEEGGMLSAGVGGAFTGRGGDLMICDDPIKGHREASSPAHVSALREWWESTFMPRAEPGACVIVMHTRWNDDDLIGYLKRESEEDFRFHNYPALALDPEIEGPDILDREEGAALCPERFSASDLEGMQRKRGSLVFRRLYQGLTEELGGNVYKRMWFRVYSERPSHFDEMTWSWDLAFKESPTSSPVVGQLWGRLGANHYLIEEVRGRFPFTETLVAFKAACDRWPQAHAKLVEDKANGPALISVYRDRIGGIIAIEPSSYGGDKVTRAVASSPFVEAGNVWIPDPQKHPWVADWLDEVGRFPLGAFKDRVDAMSQYLNWYDARPQLLI